MKQINKTILTIILLSSSMLSATKISNSKSSFFIGTSYSQGKGTLEYDITVNYDNEGVDSDVTDLGKQDIGIISSATVLLGKGTTDNGYNALYISKLSMEEGNIVKSNGYAIGYQGSIIWTLLDIKDISGSIILGGRIGYTKMNDLNTIAKGNLTNSSYEITDGLVDASGLDLGLNIGVATNLYKTVQLYTTIEWEAQSYTLDSYEGSSWWYGDYSVSSNASVDKVGLRFGANIFF
jgi:hypothetical protein